MAFKDGCVQPTHGLRIFAIHCHKNPLVHTTLVPCTVYLTADVIDYTYTDTCVVVLSGEIHSFEQTRRSQYLRVSISKNYNKQAGRNQGSWWQTRKYADKFVTRQ